MWQPSIVFASLILCTTNNRSTEPTRQRIAENTLITIDTIVNRDIDIHADRGSWHDVAAAKAAFLPTLAVFCHTAGK